MFDLVSWSTLSPNTDRLLVIDLDPILHTGLVFVYLTGRPQNRPSTKWRHCRGVLIVLDWVWTSSARSPFVFYLFLFVFVFRCLLLQVVEMSFVPYCEICDYFGHASYECQFSRADPYPCCEYCGLFRHLVYECQLMEFHRSQGGEMSVYHDTDPYSSFESNHNYEMTQKEEFQYQDSQSPLVSNPSLMSMLEIFRSEVVFLSTKLSNLEET